MPSGYPTKPTRPMLTCLLSDIAVGPPITTNPNHPSLLLSQLRISPPIPFAGTPMPGCQRRCHARLQPIKGDDYQGKNIVCAPNTRVTWGMALQLQILHFFALCVCGGEKDQKLRMGIPVLGCL
ncbi:hypothetical protein DM02DRAFT_270928 [Periconia macrospinosa]|uniref:Uncharacterized protein n=1 Tax=Periconia macrospinosa TaxID=97972 RepID=A0A2V1D3G2_9PLEO|nr:hypothetical protein DM02DRAFT_270928 [Periconia macrospinosa]